MKRMLFLLSLVLLSSVPVQAASVKFGLDADNNEVLDPNEAGQIIDLYVSGGTPVNGIQLYVMVEDGGAQLGVLTSEPGRNTPGPKITAITLLAPGSLFAGNNTGESPTILAPQYASVGTTTSSGLVNANGLLARLTIDTTGFAAGTYDIYLVNAPEEGLPEGNSQFFDNIGGGERGALDVFAAGTITINAVPEPSTIALVAIGGVFLAFRGLRRKKLAA